MERALEELVWRRACNCCEYCRMPQAFDDLTFQIDHVIAVSHGGPTRAGNLCLACFACSSFKGPNLAGIDPVTKKVVPLFNPRRHSCARQETVPSMECFLRAIGSSGRGGGVDSPFLS
jgi:hypothetical protein